MGDSMEGSMLSSWLDSSLCMGSCVAEDRFALLRMGRGQGE